MFCRYYNDLWELDLSEMAWKSLGSTAATRLYTKSQSNTFYHVISHRYYNDLWELDLSEMVWKSLGSPGQHPWPAARSGCQMMVVGDSLYMYGGYVKVILDKTQNQMVVCSLWCGLLGCQMTYGGVPEIV
jgi:hypothetical protein